MVDPWCRFLLSFESLQGESVGVVGLEEFFLAGAYALIEASDFVLDLFGQGGASLPRTRCGPRATDR